MSKKIAISVSNVSKDFKLPHEKADSIKSLFVNPFNKNRRSYEVQHALKDISFDVKEGEFFGIVGRNGSGKSTLLKIIAGIYQPNKGSVQVNGRLVPFIELGVGFNPELTGRENTYLNGALLGFSEKEVDAKYDEIVSFAEIERFMDQKLKNYSSGMQVRLAFSVATILAESDILLIDEVLAVGDAEFQRKCFDYFRKLKKENKTVIFVSHDMSAIREYCDRAVLIEKNEIVASGKSDEVAKEYTRLFLPDLYKQVVKDEIKKKNNGMWGAGGVMFNDISVDKQLYTEKDKTVEVKVSIRVEQDLLEGVTFGVSVKNDRGDILFGTNNRILKKHEMRGPVAAGTEVEITWLIPNIFNDGTYFVEPAASNYLTTYDYLWWDEASRFNVINEQRTPYIVAPKIDFKLTNK